MFDHLPTFHTTILLGDFNAKLGREDNFKLTIGKEIFYKDSNYNGVTVRSYSKIFTDKPGTVIIKKIHNQIDRVLLEMLYSNCELSGT